MSHIPQILEALARLLSYPDEHTVQTAEFLFVVLQDESDASTAASAFGAFADQHELDQLEETFTRTFDVNPACALEVGWHLFGEEYARGMFLVRMREELRKNDLAESVELPDHISHVLAVLAAMPADEAERFATACVIPAVEKMNAALADKETPYRHAVACLASVLKHRFGPGCEAAGPSTVDQSRTAQGDPLHAFPVADVVYGCASPCSGHVELVPLEIDFAATDKRTNSPASTEARKP